MPIQPTVPEQNTAEPAPPVEQPAAPVEARPPAPPVPEAAPAPERPAEMEKPAERAMPQKEEGFLEEGIETLKRRLKKPKKIKPTKVPEIRDELTVKVEKIMEQGLEEAYKELTPIQQQEFKIKGEETAFKIRQMLKSAHVKVKKIFQLLVGWLKMLPGVNRFFLEQEAKIKADKIMSLKEQYNNRK